MNESSHQQNNWLGMGVGIIIGGSIAGILNHYLQIEEIDSLVTIIVMFVGGLLGKRYLKTTKK